MAVSVSLINMKGGVGKTTLATNLAQHAARIAGLRVLLIDLDPQSNASQYVLGRTEYKAHLDQGLPTVYNVFEQFTPAGGGNMSPTALEPQAVIRKVWPPSWARSVKGSVDLVPSRLELFWTLRNPTGKEHLLARFVSKISAFYDLILIDCAPTESILTTAAYRSSRYVVIPVKPEYLASIGLPLLVRSLELFKQSYEDQEIDIAGIVFNDYDPSDSEHGRSRKEVEDYARKQGWYVFENYLRNSRTYARSARERTPIFETSWVRGTTRAEFELVADEFRRRVGLP